MSGYQRQEAVTIKDIRQSIIAGKNLDAVAIAKALIDKGANQKEIIVDGVTKAMEHLDKKCTIEYFNLLELMLAGRAAMDVIDYLLVGETSGIDQHMTFYNHEKLNQSLNYKTPAEIYFQTTSLH